MPCCIKEFVEVSGIVLHADVGVLCGHPNDAWKQPPGIVLENAAILLDPIENCSGYREYQFRRIEATLRQDVMDQVTMDTPVAILERVDEDEAERQNRGRNDGVELLGGTDFEGEHPVDQGRKIFGPSAYMLWQWRSRYPVVLADEATLDP